MVEWLNSFGFDIRGIVAAAGDLSDPASAFLVPW